MVQYLKYNLLVSRMTMGMYKTDFNSPKLIRYFYRFSRILCNISLLSGLILTIINIFNKGIKEISKTTMEIMTAAIFFSALFRTNYFYLCEDKLEKIVNIINNTFKHKTATGLEEKTLQKYDRITKLFVVAWSFSVFFTGEYMALAPLTVIHKVGRVLPLPLWYPYDWKQSPYYEITYFTQVLTQFFMVFSYGNSDMFYACTTIMVKAQFTLFGWELKNVVYTALLNLGVPKSIVMEFKNYCTGNVKKLDNVKAMMELQIHPDILVAISSNKFKEELNKAIKSCIRHHQILLDACDSMEEFYSPVLLPEILLGIFYCIFIMYGVVVTTDLSIRSTLMQYLVMCYAQIFCVTYLGQKLFDESEVLLDNLYEIPWYMCDPNFKKTFNIIQTKLLKPIKMTAWKFFDMKLTTFVFAIKTSFSFLTFLRQVTEAENNESVH